MLVRTYPFPYTHCPSAPTHKNRTMHFPPLLRSSLLCFILSLLMLSTAPAQTYPVKALQKDFEYLTKKLDTYVPSLGLYVSREEVHKVWDSLAAAIDRPMTDKEFYPYLMHAVAACEEGHISASGWGDKESSIYQAFSRDNAPVMGIQLRTLPSGLYVWQNRSHEEGPEQGDKVISINGEPVGEVLAHICHYVPADGGIHNARLAEMDQTFRAYYYLFHAQPDEFTLTVQKPDGREESYTHKALSLREQVQVRDERYGAPEEEEALNGSNFYRTAVWEEEQALYLHIRSYHESLLREHGIDPAAFWAGIFTELKSKGLQHLVIDLRGHRGGRNEFVWDLLPHINQNGLTGVFSEARAYDGKAHGTRLVQTIPEGDDISVFGGKLYALIDGATFSNGSMTAMALREFGNATILGSESASRYMGFAASSWERLQLPKTNIPVRIPYFVTTYPVADAQSDLRRGVLPDVLIEPDIDALIAGGDPVITAVKEAIAAED